MKEEYVKPELSELGHVSDLTAGNASGSKLDHTYPTNTPKSKLTFS